MTPEFCGEYFTYNDAGVCVFQADDAWADFQGDELVMQESYDFTLPQGREKDAVFGEGDLDRKSVV